MPSDDYKQLVVTAASGFQVLLCLSGVLVCQKFIKKGSSNDVSPLPFICGVVNSILWFSYGSLIDDSAITSVNIIGLMFFSAYTVAHLTFSTKKISTARLLLGVLIVAAGIIAYIKSLLDEDGARYQMGMIACGASLVFFAAPLADLAHVIKMKSSEKLPLPIILMSLAVTFLWMIYGIMIQDNFVIYPNAIGFALSGFQMSLFVLYPSR